MSVTAIAKIVHSRDDGGYYVEVFEQETGRGIRTLPDDDGVFDSREEAITAISRYAAEGPEVDVVEFW